MGKYRGQAPLSSWSITTINHLGKSFCRGHFSANEAAAAALRKEEIQAGKEFKFTRVYHHYGKCCYCGENPNVK